MNPLLPAVVESGIYIRQLELQVQELHRQLLEKSKEAEELRKVKEPDGAVPEPAA